MGQEPGWSRPPQGSALEADNPAPGGAAMVAVLALLLGSLPARSQAADVPRVAVVYSSFREGSFAYRDEYDAELRRLAWPAEKYENTRVGELAGRLGEVDLVIGTAVYNYEHPQDLTACGKAFAEFVRRGGILLLTDMNYGSQVDWLPALEPGLRISVAGERCTTDTAPARWADLRHPLLAGVERVPCAWTHPVEVSGLWTVLARCADGRPILMVRELGDGAIVASSIYHQYGFPNLTFLQNLWRWARDPRRIAAVRDREHALAEAIAAPKKLEAKRLYQPPTIDGIVEEECWNQAARTAPFVKNDGSGPAEETTTALVGLDDYWLYAAFLCADSDPEGLVTNATARDGPVYHDDCVELFVDPTGRRGTYRHFIVNAAGVVYDEAAADPAWDGWWQAAVQRSVRGWTAELRVPLVALGDPSTFAEEWATNLNRYCPRTRETSAWSPTLGPFAAPERFGALAKVNVDAKRLGLRVNGVNLDRTTLSASFGDPGERDFAGTYVVEAVSPAGKRTQTVRELRIPAGGSATVETRHAMDQPGIHTLRARVETTGPVWIGEPIRHTVAAWLEVRLPDQSYRGALYQVDRYRPAVRVVAEVREARKGMVVAGEVTGPGVSMKQERMVGGDRRVELSFPAADWAPGEYQLTVALRQGRTELASERRELRVLPAGKGSEVGFDEDGISYLNGKPFLPLGLYHVSEPVADLVSQQNATMGLAPLTLEAMLDDVRSKGFNCFVRGWGMPSRALLDLAAARGLYVMPEIGGFAPDQLREAVRSGRDHAALLMWYGVDEASGERLEHALKTRAIFLEEDPHHPVGAAVNDPALFGEAGKALDVLMPDPYPIPRWPISTVSAWAEAAERARQPGQALWLVPQAFAVYGVWNQPTPEELRNMTYQAIVAGARGLVWYAYYTTESSEAFGMARNPKRKQWWYPETSLWEYHGELNRELSGLQDAILAPGGERLTTSNEAVRALLRTTPTRQVVFAVNVAREDLEVTIRLPEATRDGTAQAIGEGREVTIGDGALMDRFTGIAVHVYEY